jgi:hypothetical protein
MGEEVVGVAQYNEIQVHGRVLFIQGLVGIQMRAEFKGICSDI